MDRTSTPSTPYINGAVHSNYVPQNTTAEDLLKSETVGLVKLDDFRKRRAEVVERKEKEKREGSGRGTPAGDGSRTPGADSISSLQQPPKKKRKAVARGKLSFGIDDDNDDEATVTSSAPTSTINTPRSNTPGDLVAPADGGGRTTTTTTTESTPLVKRLGPNTAIRHAPKIMTKAALAREEQMRDDLRKTFLETQEIVKATEFLMPFVFYDGTNTPGGVCKVKKGDYVWLFLDKARKLGAASGAGGGEKSRKEWARVGVDDLLLVKGEIIIPHHYDFMYFINAKTPGFTGAPIFNLSAKPTAGSPSPPSTNHPPSASLTSTTYTPLTTNKTPDPKPKSTTTSTLPDSQLEGYADDASATKVVDRRWYERNKHIFPASVWEEFEVGRDYTRGGRKDGLGNAFFFS